MSVRSEARSMIALVYCQTENTNFDELPTIEQSKITTLAEATLKSIEKSISPGAFTTYLAALARQYKTVKEKTMSEITVPDNTRYIYHLTADEAYELATLVECAYNDGDFAQIGRAHV